jgi:cysteine desulfurase
MPAPDVIYLDHNATAPMLPEVADAVREASLRYRGNPASQHSAGREARRALEAARERIGELLGAGRDDHIVFTSGGTEANNLAVGGLSLARRHAGGRVVNAHEGLGDAASSRIILSAIEHPSVALAADECAREGRRVDRLGVDAAGIVLVDQLAYLLGPDVRLVSVMLANNETGIRQPVPEIAAMCRERGVAMHTDAVQAVGKLSVDFAALGVDAMAIAAHKFHGPLGIGVLIVRRGAVLTPALHGGFQQSGLRPGTECVALVVGMLAALESWAREGDCRSERMTGLRDLLERQICAGDPRAVVIGATSPRLPHTSNIALVGLDRQALVMALDLAGVACSTGSACASGSSEPSPTLVAMGLPGEQISSSVRFSLGATTTAQDIDEAARRILSVVHRLRRS